MMASEEKLLGRKKGSVGWNRREILGCRGKFRCWQIICQKRRQSASNIKLLILFLIYTNDLSKISFIGYLFPVDAALQ